MELFWVGGKSSPHLTLCSGVPADNVGTNSMSRFNQWCIFEMFEGSGDLGKATVCTIGRYCEIISSLADRGQMKRGAWHGAKQGSRINWSGCWYSDYLAWATSPLLPHDSMFAWFNVQPEAETHVCIYF